MQSATSGSIDYQIVIVEDRRPYKISINISIPHRLSKEQLEAIANEVRGLHSGYERTFILYYLPGMEDGKGAWASTHFAPDLEVKILGSSIDAEAQLLEQAKFKDSEPLYVGQWKNSDGPGIAGLVRILREGDKLIWEMVLADGKIRDELVVFNENGQYRFVEVERLDDYLRGISDAEYFCVQSDNALAVSGTETGTAFVYTPCPFDSDSAVDGIDLTALGPVPKYADFVKLHSLEPAQPLLKPNIARELFKVVAELEKIADEFEQGRDQFPRGDRDLERIKEAGSYSRAIMARQSKVDKRIDAIKPPTGDMGIVWFSIIEMAGALRQLSITTNDRIFDQEIQLVRRRLAPIRQELRRHQDANRGT